MRIKKISQSKEKEDRYISSLLQIYMQLHRSGALKWISDKNWQIRNDRYHISARAYRDVGEVTSSPIPMYIIVLGFVDNKDGTISGLNVGLYANVNNSRNATGSKLIAKTEDFGFSKEEVESSQVFLEKFNAIFSLNIPDPLIAIKGHGGYHVRAEDLDPAELKRQEDMMPKHPIRFTRRRQNGKSALEVILSIEKLEDDMDAGLEVKKADIKYPISYLKRDLEDGVVLFDAHVKRRNGRFPTTPIEAISHLEEIERLLRGDGFVDKNSTEYIPEGSTKANCDFELNKSEEQIRQEAELLVLENLKKNRPNDSGGDFQSFAKAENFKKNAQDYNFEGYFSGNVPDYAVEMLGSSSVDAGQIRSIFGKANDAISMVNQYNGSLLSNVSFIFNFSKGGAYGVYLEALDRAIKEKALKKKLEQKGYTVEPNTNGALVAYSEEENISQDQVQKDIDSIYRDLQSKGGTAFGINMEAVLNSARQDASDMNISDQTILEWIAVLHLGGTIVHEAIHAKGGDEGASQSGENSFTSWALPIVNKKVQEYMKGIGKEEEFVPLQVGNKTRHAKSFNWYKRASLNYYPEAIMNKPRGSDLSGRHASDVFNDNAWGMLAQQHESVPIESRLGKQFMFPLPRGLDQSNDSIERQLRKYTKPDSKIDQKRSMEKFMEEGHAKTGEYYLTEELLNNNRPKPILKTLKKASLSKIATLFGWMNNFDITDSYNIPGLSDRVMLWDDRDDCFSAEEDVIKSQSRYNPEYDLKGFYYRWIEPRFKPALFDDNASDTISTAPARRFASKYMDNLQYGQICQILNIIRDNICGKKMRATRLLASEDVINFIQDRLDGVKFFVFSDGKTVDNEKIFSIWVCGEGCSEEDICEIESAIKENRVDDKIRDKMNILLGMEGNYATTNKTNK